MRRALSLTPLVAAGLAAAASSSDPKGSAICVTGHASEDSAICTALDRPVVVDGDPAEFGAPDVARLVAGGVAPGRTGEHHPGRLGRGCRRHGRSPGHLSLSPE